MGFNANRLLHNFISNIHHNVGAIFIHSHLVIVVTSSQFVEVEQLCPTTNPKVNLNVF